MNHITLACWQPSPHIGEAPPSPTAIDPVSPTAGATADSSQSEDVVVPRSPLQPTPTEGLSTTGPIPLQLSAEQQAAIMNPGRQYDTPIQQEAHRLLLSSAVATLQAMLAANTGRKGKPSWVLMLLVFVVHIISVQSVIHAPLTTSKQTPFHSPEIKGGTWDCTPTSPLQLVPPSTGPPRCFIDGGYSDTLHRATWAVVTPFCPAFSGPVTLNRTTKAYRGARHATNISAEHVACIELMLYLVSMPASSLPDTIILCGDNVHTLQVAQGIEDSESEPDLALTLRHLYHKVSLFTENSLWSLHQGTQASWAMNLPTDAADTLSKATSAIFRMTTHPIQQQNSGKLRPTQIDHTTLCGIYSNNIEPLLNLVLSKQLLPRSLSMPN